VRKRVAEKGGKERNKVGERDREGEEGRPGKSPTV